MGGARASFSLTAGSSMALTGRAGKSRGGALAALEDDLSQAMKRIEEGEDNDSEPGEVGHADTGSPGGDSPTGSSLRDMVGIASKSTLGGNGSDSGSPRSGGRLGQFFEHGDPHSSVLDAELSDDAPFRSTTRVKVPQSPLLGARGRDSLIGSK